MPRRSRGMIAAAKPPLRPRRGRLGGKGPACQCGGCRRHVGGGPARERGCQIASHRCGAPVSEKHDAARARGSKRVAAEQGTREAASTGGRRTSGTDLGVHAEYNAAEPRWVGPALRACAQAGVGILIRRENCVAE